MIDGSKKLSKFYREETQKSRWIKNLSRCYREGREHKKNTRWIEDLLRFLSRLKKESSIEMNLSRMYREAVEHEERRFFKGGKTYRDEGNKQATQTNIQATYGSLKTSLNHRCKAYIDPKTYTHTRTKQV